jgi:threonine synthase
MSTKENNAYDSNELTGDVSLVNSDSSADGAIAGEGTSKLTELTGETSPVNPGGYASGYRNTYTDTRGLTEHPLSFTQAIIKGIAEGGGLFVPLVLPRLALDEIISLGSLPYARQASFIYQRFGVDLPAETIEQLMAVAYGDTFDDPAIAPVVEVTSGVHVLELWHGPTSAFKDMALQCLPIFFSAAIEKLRAADAPEAREDFLILVATSGDTGKAALEGFADRNSELTGLTGDVSVANSEVDKGNVPCQPQPSDHTKLIVFYPHGGVSDIQFRQMATQRGANVGVFGVEGNFDDCQTAVKGAFSDAAFNEKLAAEHGLRLSSANSINWGRLLPQVVYYVSAYAQMVQAGTLAAGAELDICVPTGNFGNILAAWYAKEIGVPVGRLFCASNENKVLTDFINTGVYDISDRAFKLTPSPSMDILVSSNLERQLFELCGRDAAAIRGWMDDLRVKRSFQVDPATFAALRATFSADWVSNAESLATIRSVYEEHGYLLDPHTAVAWKVGERLHGENPVLIVSTAHWAKFGTDVYRALNGIPAGAPLPKEIAALSGLALNERIAAQHHAGSIPARLAELDKLPIRFTELAAASTDGIETAVAGWLEGREQTS